MGVLYAWYVAAAVTGRRASRSIPIAALAAGVLVSGCGSAQRQDASEPSGRFPVSIVSATFPSSQRLAQQARMVIAVHNTGSRTIPDLAVTICNASCATPAATGQGTATAPFSQNIDQPGLASNSRPVWIVDKAPGVCGYSCHAGGAGGDVTAYSDTWASGPLKSGATATFAWQVTAIKPGRHVVAYQVAAGLNGKAQAVLGNGSSPRGTFHVSIANAPAQSYVGDQGQVINKP